MLPSHIEAKISRDPLALSWVAAAAAIAAATQHYALVDGGTLQPSGWYMPCISSTQRRYNFRMSRDERCFCFVSSLKTPQISPIYAPTTNAKHVIVQHDMSRAQIRRYLRGHLWEEMV